MLTNNSKVKSSVSRILTVLLAFVMIASSALAGAGGLANEAYAKDVGDKNKQACDHCEMVVNGEAPSMADYSSYMTGESTLDDRKSGLSYNSNGYSTTEETYERLLNGAVYRGGNSESGLQQGPTLFDDDPNDFANVLPYGNTYINTSKLNWTTSSNFKIDIADTQHFKWIAGSNYASTKDANGTPVDTDPLGGGRGLDSGVAPIIAYVGHLNGYLGDDDAAYRGDAQASPASGHENIFDAGSGYLYKITYPEAVTLKDGTKGALIIEVNRVEIETTATQDDAIVTLQTANDINVGGQLKDASGAPINVQTFVAKTKSEVEAATAGNSAWTYGGRDKSTRTATGAIIDFDIKVVDAAGNPVKGSISYAASDMDLDSYQSLWGRSSAGEDRYKFNESVTIIDGSLSYAVTPYYDHANGDMRVNGWIPVAYGQEQLSSPLHITQTGMGDGQHANGVRFSGVGTVMIRDENDKFENALFDQWGNIITVYGGYSHSSDTDYKDVNKNTIPDVVKEQLYGKIKNGNTVVPVNQMTNQQILDYIGQGSYGSRRGDNGTYETGFAVLLNATESKMRWSGSMQNGGNLTTRLFDTTIYTYIEQTHGTGGGIYFETYDIADDCKVNRAEGTITMGKGTDATVTVVPEDGYRIDTIQIGKKELENPRTFTPVYDTGGTVTTIKDHDGNEYAVSNDGKVTIPDTIYGSITFDVNDGGSIDVTLPNMQDARHIHADFTADYYFYKVWKGKEAPTDLKMTATPFAFVFRDVNIEGKKYTINGNTFTDPNGNSYELKDNYFTVGEGADAVSYFLEGNNLVTYTTDSVTGERTKDKTYAIRLEFVKNGAPVEFMVTEADAENSEETHVTKGTEDGYTVWKITYPEKGCTTKDDKKWDALPIEKEPSAHNINHVERNYWFVTEEAPGWSLVSYDNTKAEAAGHIDTAESRKEIYKEGSAGDISAWAQASTKDYTQAMSVIAGASEKNHAYMSVFNSDDNSNYSWGGKIVNVPALVVNVEKTWVDESNAYNTRKDVWFHLDGTITKDDQTTTIKDILPPQKLAVNDSQSTATLTWGKKEAYGDSYLSELADYANVKVVGKASAIPESEKYMQDASNPRKYIPRSGSGTTYYINELADEDGLTYSVRETDKDGNALKQYTVTTEAMKIDASSVQVDGVDVDSYTTKINNELETVTIKATKVWADNDNYYEIRKDLVFNLNADGTKVAEKTIPANADETGRTVEWTVPKYNTAGNEIKYTIDENFVNEANTGPYARADSGDASAGFVITNTYPPHEETMTVTRTITYTYIDENGETASETVVQTVNLKRTPKAVDKTTYKETWGDWEYADDNPDIVAVDSPGITGWKADKNFVPEWTIDMYDPKDAWEHVVYTPKQPVGTPDETYGLKGQPQTGTPSFNVSTPTTPDRSDNEIVDIKLVDPETGNLLTEVKVPEGTYKLNNDGTVTFTPLDPNFTGDPTPINLKGTDKNGLSAETTYTPHIKESEEKGEASRTIHYTYLTKDGETASKDVKQTVKLTRRVKSINQKTGEVEWGPWEDPDNPGQSAKFPAVPNPDDVDENTWTPDSSAQEQTVTEPGTVPDVHIVYTKEPYTVIYHNGDHGKSDGKGNQSNEDYGNDVTGGNGVTPAKGWHFTGKYTYIIKDKNGNVIKTGETNDPTTVEIIGNVEFTPVYAPNKYTIKYDPNGGSGKMSDQKFTGADSSATSKSNKFTRKGYKFTGFKAKLPDGTYLKDANGNDLVFENPDDFLEYLHAQGDGGEITLVAQWTKVKGAATGDDTNVLIWLGIMAAALAASGAIAARRRRSER